MNPTITSEHIYNCIADALNNGPTPAGASSDDYWTFEEVEAACKKLHDKGINITTYADAVVVADVLSYLSLV